MAVEAKRGCGYRKVGGLYLVDEGSGMPCCKMPLELSICPCCGAGIKQSRGWTWVDAGKLFPPGGCVGDALTKSVCPAVNPGLMGRVGLLWIGEKFYPRPIDFLNEAASQGISRRLSNMPRDYKAGETWVLFAHPKAIEKPRKVGYPNGRGFDVAIERPDGSFETNDDGGMIVFEIEDDAAKVAAEMDLRDPIFVPGVIRIARPKGFEKIVKQSDMDAVAADMASYEADESEARVKSPLLEKFERDRARGITWVPVPDNDPDHQGTVYDNDREEVA